MFKICRDIFRSLTKKSVINMGKSAADITKMAFPYPKILFKKCMK